MKKIFIFYYNIIMTWSIYGNKYDLTPFIDKHPGGKEILQKTKDMGDITPLFESYHAFSNKEHHPKAPGRLQNRRLIGIKL
jgi:cytochrome b involved in lipid metabolism